MAELSRASSIQEPGQERRHRGRTIALAVTLVIVVCLVTFGVTWWLALHGSLVEFASRASLAKDAGETLEADAAGLDAAVLDEDTQALAEHVHAIYAQTEGWEWDVAERLPVLGSDVRTGRELAGIAQRMVDEALQPVTSSYRELSRASGVDAVLQGTSDLVDALSAARQVTQDCQSQVDALPIAKLGPVQAAIDETNVLLKEINSYFDAIEPAIEAAQAVRDVAQAVGGIVEEIAQAPESALATIGGLMG